MESQIRSFIMYTLNQEVKYENKQQEHHLLYTL